MPPPPFPREAILEDPKVAPPYTDLWVPEIVTKPDHDNQRLYASAVIANRGQAPPSYPILVHTVVRTHVFVPQYGDWLEMPTEEWQWWNAGQTLPFRTDWMWAPLHYVEDGGSDYEVWVYVGDESNLVGDRNLHNNLDVLMCPSFHKPATFTPEMKQPLRRETRIEGGKLTTKLTMGGKPLKK